MDILIYGCRKFIDYYTFSTTLWRIWCCNWNLSILFNWKWINNEYILPPENRTQYALFLEGNYYFFPAFIIPLIYGIVINYYIDLYNISNLLILGLLYVVIFSLSLWNFGMNEYEKTLIRSTFN